jgi:hypothetical protein
MNRSPEDIYARPYFQELQAVKARRVLVVSESLYSRPGPRSAEAVEELARFLHPEAWEKQGSGVRDQKKISWKLATGRYVGRALPANSTD